MKGRGARGFRQVGLRGEGLLAQRGWFHASFRLADRLFDLSGAVRSAGWGSPRVRQGVARLPLDVAGGVFLQRSRRFALVARLGLDAYDIATTSAVRGQLSTAAGRLGVPLATEAGIRMGPAGMVVPVANLVALALLGRRRKLAAKPAALGWQVLGVLAGMAIASHEERLVVGAMARHVERVAAECDRARLAGQNAVAMGTDSVIDLLARTAFIVEAQAGARPVTQAMLSSWKALLASDTEQRATYLDTALHRWQRRHNDQPTLAHDVEVHLGEGEGTVMLSASQIVSLEGALDAMGLRGAVAVHVADDGPPRRFGAPLRLSVAGHEVVLGADPKAVPAAPDLGPAALCLAALLCALPVLPTQGAARPESVALAAGWFLAASYWAHRQVTRYGPSAHQRVFLVGLAGCLLQSLTSAPALHQPLDDNGLRRLVFVPPLLAQGCLGYLYRQELGPRVRQVAAAGVLASIGAGVALTKPSAKDLFLGLSWPAVALVSSRGLPQALEERARALTERLREQDDGARRQAFEEGRGAVLNLVATTTARLRELLGDNRGDVSDDDLAAIEGRLDEVDKRLAEA